MSKTNPQTVDQKDIVVSVKDLKKTFRLPHESHSGIKQLLLNTMRRKKNNGYEVQRVLNGITFDVHKGDFFGIVGRNGSGKSTLLKSLAGIYQPDSGAITTEGSIVPFIELGVGFNPELTGRENIFLNGALLGFSRDEMRGMYDEIVEFAEIERFMDQKLKNYSSGMQVRLAFSIAIKAQGDILILDEVLAVGDEAFQRKCNDFFTKIKKDKSKTVILVTHSMDSVKKYCNRAIMIRDGDIVASGDPSDVANEYSLENIQTTTVSNAKKPKEESIIKGFNVELLSKQQLSQGDKVKIRLSYQTTTPLEAFTIVSLKDLIRNAPIFDTTSDYVVSKVGDTVTHTVELDLSEINDAEFRVHAQIRDKTNQVLAWIKDEDAPLTLFKRTDYSKVSRVSTYGVLLDKANWTKAETRER